jgi:hypothetical protein
VAASWRDLVVVTTPQLVTLVEDDVDDEFLEEDDSQYQTHRLERPSVETSTVAAKMM